jgi:hypothetical protein
MPIGDAQLKTWSKHGSVAQSRDTYAAIKNVLENQDAPYSNKDFTVFLQGSYGNETNVYAESDVDIVMELQSTFYRDLARLSDLDRDAYENAFSNATYNHSDFKKDAVTWLMKRYGKAAKPGTKAIFVEENGNRRNADVLVAAQFRRYYQFTTISNQRFEEGICFFLKDGTLVENFPKQHSRNCTNKHQTTSDWFKPTVRFFKNIRNRMIDDGLIADGVAPSYYLEDLLYNVPPEKFGGSHQDTFVECSTG